MHEQARRLLRAGKTVRQVAAEADLTRKEVEELAWDLTKARTKRNWYILSISMFVIAAFAAYWFGWRTKRQLTRTATNRQWVASIEKSVKALADSYLKDVWMLETESLTPAHFHAEMNFIKTQTARVEKALEDNAEIPEVADLKKEFSGLIMTSIFSKATGGSKIVSIGPKPNFEIPKHTIEVCFVPREAESHPRVGGRLLKYDQNWRALLIGALEYRDPRWFDALTLHELFHARMHRVGSPSATAPMWSDLWISEELVAHKLEDAILDRATNGAYLTTIKRIAGQIKARTLPEFLSQITSDNLLEIDGNFVKSSRREGQIRASQYLISLTNHWLVIRYNDPRPLGEQAKAYKLITQNL